MPTDTPKLSFDSLLCFNVYALNLAFSRFYQHAFGQTGFTYPKFLVLLALEEAGPMSLSAMAARIGAEANTLSPLVKRMGTFGLLERIRDPSDERRVVISLKPFGHTVLDAAKAVIADSWDQLNLSDDAVHQTIAVLKEVRTKLDAAPPARTLNVPNPSSD